MTDTPVTVNCNENAIVDAILLLSKIKVDKDKLCTLAPEQINDIAASIILESCKAVVDALRDEAKGPHVIAEFISRSNLKYLTRELH